MRILFIIFLSLFSALALSSSGFANEMTLESFQQEMSRLQNLVVSLQSTLKDLTKTVEGQNEIIHRQSVRINALEGDKSFPAGSMSAPAGAPKLAGISQGFNPDIGLVASIEAKSTQSPEDGEGNDTIALKEAELSISQYVDPFSRLDSVIAFNDNLEEQNVDIEELYYTRWGLPLGVTAQIGKFRPKIGKANLLHSHQLDTAGYPLVIRDFFGEEGLASSGARLQTIIPNPWDVPFEVSAEVLRGNNGASFSGISRRPIFDTHLKTFINISENSQLELGGTVLFGDENPAVVTFEDDALGTEIPEAGQNKYGIKVFGADATFYWFLPESKVLKLQNEIYFQNRATHTRFDNQNPWGLYALLDFRFSKRWSVGLRYDHLQPLSIVGGSTEGVSPYLTFWQSEFADFRLQYSYTKPADDGTEPNHEVFLKANVLIGAHKHPVQ
ncbi:MAG: hypothetical protein COV74_04800 [Candidatus Omnitrophica bacterium CG11_big_fil_rev_8_21_14_0_20_45_26]|uniref:Uncharacterized protein n=1 Tax=Candidatus Abzuiibacterium crystallinum TaxID=1974748 RepID=A0A2H0LPL8_9BACT|nr:MAG: hypothetical protein COV74_04800 [Candidatus Omnitrophica bacterium CG11_big_fil_rev_8_21_14_0_20_45_26]PIW63579.1 MAG: hypothetical protein COW12_09715 [Candidatus Omnitrophica bacterium CG12_big_fil_rev_8_21_14_0_65_45_16]